MPRSLVLLLTLAACQTEPLQLGLSQRAGGLIRLSPEEVSNRFEQTLGVPVGSIFLEEEDLVFEYDYIVAELGVALGGIDFVTADIRDRSTRVSTLLLVHSVAFTASNQALYSDYIAIENDRTGVLFRTFEDLERTGADAGFDAQIEHLYWQILRRPVCADELLAVREAFDEELAAGSEAWRAWQMVLYSLFSTVEFWTR